MLSSVLCLHNVNKIGKFHIETSGCFIQLFAFYSLSLTCFSSRYAASAVVILLRKKTVQVVDILLLRLYYR